MDKKNFNLLLVYSFLNNFLLYRSCDVLYYISKGISNSTYINYLSIGSLITIIFLLPLGIVKDKYNRKIILIISNLFLLFSILFYIYADNSFYMSVGIILTAISNLLSQGIVISLLHNYVNKKEDYSRIYYKWSIFYYSGYLISMVIGGIVAKYNLVLMYYLSIIPVILNFFILFMLNDEEEKKKRKNTSNYILKESFRCLKESTLLKFILLSSIIITPLADILAESHPEYLSEIGASTILIGLYTALMCLFGIVGNKIASTISKKIKYYIIYFSMFAFCLIGIGIVHNYLAIVLILLFQCFFSVTNNIYNATIQDETNDCYRQTILAMFTFIISLSEIILCNISSYLFNKFGLGLSYIILGIIGLIFAIIIGVIYLIKILKSDKK